MVNFSEFYQRKPIAISETDKRALQDSYHNWLIALEGVSRDSSLHWQVHIYPIKADGTYDINSPHFSSVCFQSFDEAISYADELEKLAKHDKLTTISQK